MSHDEGITPHVLELFQRIVSTYPPGARLSEIGHDEFDGLRPMVPLFFWTVRS